MMMPVKGDDDSKCNYDEVEPGGEGRGQRLIVLMTTMTIIVEDDSENKYNDDDDDDDDCYVFFRHVR